HMSSGGRADPVRQPGTVRRIARAAAVFCHQPGFTSQNGNYVNAPTVALGTEGDLATVRRECRLMIVGLMGREPEYVSAAELAHPDVEVPRSRPIRGIGQQTPVRRDGRVCGEAGIIG